MLAAAVYVFERTVEGKPAIVLWRFLDPGEQFRFLVFARAAQKWSQVTTWN